ncbi:hypothetical protein YYC_04824 [Plasmodium yoelii 17X]|uniref:YIR protein n=1 Tax=Plasmodium yoelii 17X TaxID=1323249 RepID=V7PCM0_PLAYE|nr:hypothetical protein YYC_04824 [Plasmodium yoelii 17X]
MEDTLCKTFNLLRMYLPDEFDEKAKIELKNIANYNKYCPNNNCNTDLDKITIGFLWLLGQYFTKYPIKGNSEYNTKPFFLYIILWLCYKLNKNSDHNSIKINDFYTDYVKNSDKYNKFISDSSKFTKFEEFIDGQKDLFNIKIKDLSKFYDAFKLLCNIQGNFETNNHDKLSNNANEFVKIYQELNGDPNNTNDSSYKQILSALSTDYDNLRKKRSNIASLPEITADVSAYISRVTSSSSSIGNKSFIVLSIFGAIAFFLGISYKYSLFGFRKRAKKQYLREKIKNIKKKMNH